MRNVIWTLILAILAVGFFAIGHQAGQQHAEQSTETAAHKPSARDLGLQKAKQSPARSPRAPQTADVGTIRYSQLPREARKVLSDIDAGGPYEFPRDGITFQNRERLLPLQKRGYYREFTVRTPGSRDRGARRIVTGGKPPVEYYYTDDHYRSFAQIREIP